MKFQCKLGGTMTEKEYDELICLKEKLMKEMEYQITEDDQMKRYAENYDKYRMKEKLELAFNLSTSITMALVAIILIVIVIKIL